MLFTPYSHRQIITVAVAVGVGIAALVWLAFGSSWQRLVLLALSWSLMTILLLLASNHEMALRYRQGEDVALCRSDRIVLLRLAPNVFRFYMAITLLGLLTAGVMITPVSVFPGVAAMGISLLTAFAYERYMKSKMFTHVIRIKDIHAVRQDDAGRRKVVVLESDQGPIRLCPRLRGLESLLRRSKRRWQRARVLGVTNGE